MSLRRFAFILVPFVMAGCASSGTSSTQTATVNATLGPEVSTVIRTPLTPLQAAARIGEVYKEFRFKGLNNGGLFGTAKPDGDFFSSTISSLSASGERVVAICQWKQENQTDVTVKSTLTQTQHDFLVKRIDAALERPTTRPGGVGN